MSSSYSDELYDGLQVALHLLFCEVLLPEFVQNNG